MSSQKQRPEHNTINEANLNALVGGILHDLGGAFSVPLVQIGESLGLYQTLSENGPLSSGGTGREDGIEGALSPRVALRPGGIEIYHI